jgi:hypothetical protein
VPRSDRPLFRSLVKLGARLLLGRARAHAQDWFPGLAIRRNPEGGGEVSYRGAWAAKLMDSSLLRTCEGGTVTIVGSGPSVALADLSRLVAGSAILLNGAIHLIGNPVAVPLAVAIEDERFVWRHFDLLRQKIGPRQACLFSVAVLRAICEHDSSWLADKRIVLIDDLRKPYGEPRRREAQLRGLDFACLDPAGECGFSLEPDRGVFQGGSVAVSALQFAVAALPKTIGFIGVDIRNAASPRFYETADETAYSGIAGAEARIVGHLALGRTVAAERGVDVINFSPVSALADAGFAFDSRLLRAT